MSSAPLSATMIQQSAASQQQKAQLPNPLELEDYEILHKVYLTHVNDDEKYDKDILFKLVSNILSDSAQISGTALATTSFKPDFPALKRISCQMITTRGAAQCAHQTTMWILQRLRCYSWDAKALITLAAFSLEYGEFWHLYRIPSTDQLGNSLKQLNQVQTRKVPADIIGLVMFLVEKVLPLIMQWETWSAMGYDTEKVHSLPDAMQEIPLVVYWAVAAIVACTGNFVGVSDYKLPEFHSRLEVVVGKFKYHLDNCKAEIGKIDDYQRRLKASQNIKDVVGFLRLLIIHDGNGSEIPQLYEGNNKVKTGIEVFKQKYVLLFISGLQNIGDEVLLLNSIYKRLKEDPKVVKGFTKEDFKILWIPMVDNWNDGQKEAFKTRKEGLKWYVLEYFSELPGFGIIQKKLKFQDSPIVSVISPSGDIMNENALDVIFPWGIDAFPFRKSDGEDLSRKWNWLWSLLKKVDPDTDIESFKKGSYIFIYGGNDSKWIQDFKIAIGKIKKHRSINDVDVIIEHHQLGEDNRTSKIPYFWIGIDGKKQNKTCQDKVDCEIQDAVKSLLCLKQDPLGWVILSKGQHITLLGHGDPMLQTVADFEIWKDRVLEEDSFDIAFKEYYNTKVKEISARNPCAHINVDNNTSSVLATITCPNPTCGRVMEVTSVNYRCCHRDDPNSCSI